MELRCSGFGAYAAAVAWLIFLSTPVPGQIVFSRVPPDVISARLGKFAGKDLQREETLKELFIDSGCEAQHLSEQAVKHEKLPNLVCVLPGESEESIIVGAHYDHASEGDGVVDNWSGASLLPSLFESLHSSSRRHTFVFVAFAGEEDGRIGSVAFAKSMTAEQRERTEAMVNMDTLGLGPSEVWVSHADKALVQEIGKVASGMHLPVSAMNVDNIGDTDSTSFEDRKIAAITIHSVTSKTWPILHSKQDRLSAIRLDDYYQTYELVAAYLAALDHDLQPRSVAAGDGHQ